MTKPPDRSAYHMALGQFVEIFALTEYAAFFYLFKRIGLTAPEAAALLSGTKTTLAADLVKNLYKARELTIPMAVNNALSQLKLITTLRNTLLHYGFYHDQNGDLITSNWPISRPGKTMQIYPAGVQTLKEAADDLHTIMDVLFMHADGDSPDLSKLVDTQKRCESARLSAWQYKPPAQHPKNPTPR